MAVTPPQEDAFLREVDEELRREQLQAMSKRYGMIALLVIILFLAAFGGWLFWRAQVAKSAEQQGEQLSAAIADIQAGRRTDATTKVDALAKDGSPAYRTAALFTQAALAADENNIKTASAIYAAIAADSANSQPLRDLATIRQITLEFDTLKPQQVIDRLKPLAIEGNAFFGTAGELTAIALLQSGRSAEAGRLLAAVAGDKDTPASLRARAGRLATSLGATVSPDAAADSADKD